MPIVDFLALNAHWLWIVAGLVLLALDRLLRGGVLLCMGMSAVVTGLVALFSGVGWPLQWAIFGVLSLLSIALWIRWKRSRPTPSGRPYLNRRADQMIGQEAPLEQAIEQGFGRVVLGDTLWRVSGADLPSGQRVRIIGSEGAVLKVEAIN